MNMIAGPFSVGFVMPNALSEIIWLSHSGGVFLLVWYTRLWMTRASKIESFPGWISSQKQPGHGMGLINPNIWTLTITITVCHLSVGCLNLIWFVQGLVCIMTGKTATTCFFFFIRHLDWFWFWIRILLSGLVLFKSHSIIPTCYAYRNPNLFC